MQFWFHFGLLLVPFWDNFGIEFRIDFRDAFLATFLRFGGPFSIHFGLQNRSRGHPDAKRTTLDFEQPSNENQAF